MSNKQSRDKEITKSIIKDYHEQLACSYFLFSRNSTINSEGNLNEQSTIITIAL